MKRMAKEEGEMAARKQDQERLERDFEMFLQDVEENEELRREMALYKAQEKKTKKNNNREGSGGDKMETESVAPTEEEEDDDDDEGEGVPKIDMEELLDDFDELSVGDEE